MAVVSSSSHTSPLGISAWLTGIGLNAQQSAQRSTLAERFVSWQCASRAGQSPAVQGARDVWSYPEHLFLLLLLWGLAWNDAKSIRQGQVATFFCQSRLLQEIPALEFTIKPKKPHWSKQKYQILSLELRLRLHFYHTGRTKPNWVICFSFLNSFCLKDLMLWTKTKQNKKNTSPWFPLWISSHAACTPGDGDLLTPLLQVF